jgi:hypothetical protein
MNYEQAQEQAARLIESGQAKNAVVEQAAPGSDQYAVVIKEGMRPEVGDQSWERR